MKTISPKVSVIVPVFNTESYLEMCLNSIAEQTFKEFEVIIVDDASTDESKKIITEVVKRDHRFRAIYHEKNLGLGGARNSGIKASKAKYIMSVDSDDWIDPNMIAVLHNQITENDSDVVCCGFKSVDNDGKELSSNSHRLQDIEIDPKTTNIFRITNPAFWNKIWKKTLFTKNNIWFPEKLFYQDTATTPRIYAKTKKLRVIPDKLYNYRQRPGSATLSVSDKNILDYFRVFDIIFQFLREENMFSWQRRFFQEAVRASIKHHITNVLQSESNLDKTQYVRHLLLLADSYYKRIDDVLIGYSHDQISNLAKSKSLDILPEVKSGFETVPISIIVKTILRPKMIERFLRSVAQYQNENGVIFAEILVGDDTPNDKIQSNIDVINAIKQEFTDLALRYEILGSDIGLAAGRNRMVSLSSQRTILLCDDDFILDPECDIRSALELLRNSNASILGGWLKNKFDLDTGSYEYWGSCGTMIDLPTELVVLLKEDANDIPDLCEADYILNFFLAEKSTLIDNPWREDLFVEEHLPFFYDLKRASVKIIFSKSLFARHTHEIDYNPEEYNARRHDKSRWEYFLRRTLAAIGKERRTFYRWKNNSLVVWQVANDRVAVRPNEIPLGQPILEQRVPIKRLTPPHENWFFGYYDLNAFNADGSKIVVQSCPAPMRLPEPSDPSLIGIINASLPEEIETIGHTTAWCHQQGSQLQFIGNSEEQVIWNKFDEHERNFKAEVFNTKSGEKSNLERPIAAVSPNGKFIASINFSRLFDYRAGYGYGHVLDPYANVNAPTDDGLWITELKTGKASLIFSLKEICEKLAIGVYSEYRNAKWVINHVKFNPSGNKVFFLVRPFSASPPYPTFSMTCDIDGKNLKRVFGFVSHYDWLDDDNLIVSGSPFMKKCDIKEIGVYSVNTESGVFDKIVSPELTTDGHCSYSPDRTMLMYDSYPSKDLPYQRITIRNMVGNARSITLGWFFASHHLHGISDTRCDLHPRWSQDGRFITFDSIHEGYRAVYMIDVSDVIQELNRFIPELSSSQVQNWCERTNNGRKGISLHSKDSLPLIMQAPDCNDSVQNLLLARDIEDHSDIIATFKEMYAVYLRSINLNNEFFERLNFCKNELARLCVFNSEWYLQTNQDVEESGADPFVHYFLHGCIEGRRPSEYFYLGQYIYENPSLLRSGENPLIHFLENSTSYSIYWTD